MRSRLLCHSFIAQITAPQTSAIRTAAIANRSMTDMRKIDGVIAAGGWP
jgi:hypothetical protein